MVTGDNINTARFIAKECGILTDDGVALEGPEFRKMSESELMNIVPKLQVRCPCLVLIYYVHDCGVTVLVAGVFTATNAIVSYPLCSIAVNS